VKLNPVVRGDYEELPFAITEPYPDEPGLYQSRDVSLDTFRFTAKQEVYDDAAVVEKSTEDGGILFTDAGRGELTVVLLREDLASVTHETDLACSLVGTPPGTPPKDYTTMFLLPVRFRATPVA